MIKTVSSGLLLLLVCISAANGCLTLYEHYGPSGSSIVICDSTDLPSAWNDRVSAIVVPAGWRATLYRDYAYGGGSLDIGSGTWSASADWNDKLSSLKIYQGCPVFFEHYDLQGSNFVICRSGNVPSGFNDKVSSLFIPDDYDVTLYRDYGYAGPDVRLKPGKNNVPAYFNDQLSSVEINGGCPVFYEHYNFEGNSFVSCLSLSAVPSGWNDKVSSIWIPAGWRAILFRDYNFEGPSIIANAGSWAAPAGWNDQLSSFKLERI